MTDAPRSTAQAALAKARRHLGPIALIAAIVPLSSLAAHAGPAAPAPTITGTVSQTAGGYDYDYHVANNTGSTINLVGIELPELTAGGLNFGAYLQPFGWTAQQSGTAQFPGSLAGAKSGAGTAAYVDLIYSGGTGGPVLYVFAIGIQPSPAGYSLANGTSLDFNAFSATGTTTPANFSVETSSSGIPAYTQVDPPIPNSTPASAVPEPASAAILGAGVVALLARKRRNT